MFLGFEAIFHS